jgi:8-oxo-dGTP pyrophosphatase MutT (NUDIX family)
VPEFLPRRAARVLLVDDNGRLLMFRGFDPARPEHRYWFTPGGGLDADEPPAAGAARELAEETGLRVSVAQLGDPVWQEITEFPFDGRWYRQEQQFFLVRAPGFVVDTAGFDDVERGSIDGHRWWSVEDLERTSERFYPADLPKMLRRAIGDDRPC